MPSSPSSPAHLRDSLWRFSLALYSRPGVAKALIALQDRDGIDVNFALFGLWLGAVRGVALGALPLPEIAAATAPVRQSAILPLRALRRMPGTEAFPGIRARVLGAELAAERAMQMRLAKFAASASEGPAETDRLAVAAANFTICLDGRQGIAESEIVLRAVKALTRRG